MTRLALLSALCAGAAAHADLLAVQASIEQRLYYRISLDDGAVTLINQLEDQSPLVTVALGPDGHHYAVGSALEAERVDPFTGAGEVLHGFDGDTPRGGLAVSGDGLMYTSASTYTDDPIVYVWDVHADEWADTILVQDEDIFIQALHFRSDGALLATGAGDDTLYELVPQTGALVPLLEMGLEPDQRVSDFATDPRTGLTYVMLQNPRSLWEVDLYTFEREMVADLSYGVHLTGISGITLCLADFDEDGELGFLDFVHFQVAFQAGDMAADVNGDGVLDVLDFVAFQAIFQEGCP